MSYAKSAAIVTDGVLSRQTVKNHIQKVNVPEFPKADELREVKELHVFADEDHVHLQKPEKFYPNLEYLEYHNDIVFRG